jgi:hypothetical protein
MNISQSVLRILMPCAAAAMIAMMAMTMRLSLHETTHNWDEDSATTSTRSGSSNILQQELSTFAVRNQRKTFVQRSPRTTRINDSKTLPILKEANDNDDSDNTIIPLWTTATSNNGTILNIKKRPLPSCQTGCILLFFHIPKTGGTTLKRTLKKYKPIRK